jgi:hypothetical protein
VVNAHNVRVMQQLANQAADGDAVRVVQ